VPIQPKGSQIRNSTTVTAAKTPTKRQPSGCMGFRKVPSMVMGNSV